MRSEAVRRFKGSKYLGATCRGFIDRHRPAASPNGQRRKVSANMPFHQEAHGWPVQDQTWAKSCRSGGVSSAAGQELLRRSNPVFRRETHGGKEFEHYAT